MKIRREYIPHPIDGLYWRKGDSGRYIGIYFTSTEREIWISTRLPIYRIPGTLTHEIVHLVIDLLGFSDRAQSIFDAIDYSATFSLNWPIHCVRFWRDNLRESRMIKRKGGDYEE